MPPERPLRSVDPATEELIEEFTPHTGAEVDAVLGRAASAAARWRTAPIEERCAALAAVAAALRARADRLAGVITSEMGKPLAEARAEVEKCAFACDEVAAAAPAMLAERELRSDASRSTVVHQPLGAVLAVMPWNFPLWQVVRFLAPAIAAGNVGVLKHAASTTRCALEIEGLMAAAGLPASLLGVLIIPIDGLAAVVADPRIAAVTLTGSTGAGAAIGEVAARCIKKVVLELGGSDAFVVLEDADLDAAAATAVRSRFQNCGQSCIAAKRFLVVDPVFDAFAERCISGARALRQGDPRAHGVTLGPQAREDLRDTVAGQLAASVAQGARVLAGGGRGRERGWFHEATVVDGVEAGMPVVDEEVFGPVMPLVRVGDDAGAVAMANASVYGLGGNVWTSDLERGRRVALQLECGGVFINGMTHSDPRLPFGGVKQSGHGRELSETGIRAFTNEKVIWVGPARA